LIDFQNVINSIIKDFENITIRANPNILNKVVINYHDQKLKLNSVASILANDTRMIVIQPWDKSMISAIIVAVRDCGLGFNPFQDGHLIRVPVPMVTEERRNELSKIAKKISEEAKIAIRHVRQNKITEIKFQSLSKDIEFKEIEKLQNITNSYTKQVENLLEKKIKDITGL
jgi:ribosome recycling factor